MTWVSWGACLWLPLTSYRKMNCVEAAVSVVPSGLTSEFMPAQRTARVFPSGLSCDRTASPAMKFGYAARFGFRNCCTAPRGAVGVTYWPVAVCHDITFELALGWAGIGAGNTMAKAPTHNMPKERSILLSIDFMDLLLEYG